MSETSTVTLSQKLRSLADYATDARPISRLTDLGRIAVRNAADEIEAKDAELTRLTAQVKDLTEALRPFAKIPDKGAHPDCMQLQHAHLQITYGDVRKANAAYGAAISQPERKIEP